MKAEIISIGTELLLGQITNTNARFLSERLNDLGLHVYFHTVVGDNPDRLRSQLEISTSRSDVLIFTGGLGPTKDDLTKECIARFLGRELELNQAAMEQIKQFFQSRKTRMTANNQRQAMVIKGCRLFPNENGLAPGMAVAEKGKHFLLFPGPPSELQPMFEKYGTAYLQKLNPNRQVVYSKVMRFCGIGESSLEMELQDLIDGQTNPTIAPLAKEGEVTLRMTSLSASKEAAEENMRDLIEEIKRRVGEYVYGWDDDELPSVLVRLLQENGMTISVAESCTGGLLSHYITGVSGASAVFPGGTVCYATRIKQLLGLGTDVIEQDGVVSGRCARELAVNIRRQFGTDVGLGITGVAGPTPQEGKPIGLVYIGIALGQQTIVKEVHLGGNRSKIKLRAAKLAMFWTIKAIEQTLQKG